MTFESRQHVLERNAEGIVKKQSLRKKFLSNLTDVLPHQTKYARKSAHGDRLQVWPEGYRLQELNHRVHLNTE